MMSVLPLSAQTTVPQLNGMVVSSSDNTTAGLYELPTAQGGDWTFKFEVDSRTTAIYSGVLQGDIYYATRVNAQYGTLVYVDAFDMSSNTKLWTNYLSSAEYLPYDLAYNPADGLTYGIFSNKLNDGVRLCTVTYGNNTTAINVIKELEGYWVAIACDADGQLYGIRSEMAELIPGAVPEIVSSSLYKLDRHTGAETLIGETGQKPLLSGSATIDTRSGRMFWSVGPNSTTSYLCEVDLATGKAEKLFDFDGTRQIVGMYAPVPPAEDDAPAAVSDVTVTFPEGALTGTVEFTAPTTLYDGTPASGALTYTVTLDGEAVSTGSTTFGARTSAEVSVSQRGAYTFRVYVTNAAGSSPKTECSGFAGYGTPLAPGSVNVTKGDGKLLVSWDAVTASADGGYINPANVTYNVTRMPDGVAVASGITGTSVEVPVNADSEMTALSFQVVAVNGDIVSDAAVSGNVVIGYPSLPWSEGFDTAASLDFFNIIDANDDANTWAWNNGVVRVKYNTSKAMDDWLMSPPLRLQAGNTYSVSFKARSENPRYPERVEARWGVEPVAAAMSGVVVEPVELGGDFVELSGYITPATDGVYYLGIHGISNKDCFYLNVDDITVKAGLNLAVPAPATGFEVVADATGAYKADVSLKAPSLTMGDAALESIEKIEILLGETVVHTFQAPTPGSQLSAEVELPEGGFLTLAAVAYNAHGAGPAATVEAFVGTPVAAAPAGLLMTEKEHGMVTLTWEPVKLSADNQVINSARVKYNVYDVTDGNGVLVESGLTETSAVVKAVDADDAQRFMQYAVVAVTEGGESERAVTPKLPVGTPYSGFAESFADGKASTVYMFENIKGGNWAIVSDSGYGAEVTSQDADGGYLNMNAYFAGYAGAYYTGKINLEGLDNPTLCFYSYTPDNEGLDHNTVAVSVSADGGEYVEVFRKTVLEMGGSMGWHEVLVSLGDYVGKTVSLRFYAETYERPYVTTYLDNLSVFSLSGVDMELTSISAPVHVRAGDDFMLKVGIANKSAMAVNGHVIDVYADGELLLTRECDDLAPMGDALVEIPMTMHALSEMPVTYYAVVRHDDDIRDENNTSSELTVTPVVSALPAPTGLTASGVGSEVQLSWSAPELSTVPAPAVTDDFENSLPWAHSAPGWVFADRDNSTVAGFANVEIPGLTPGVTHASFITFSATGIFQGNRPLAPHSGTQYLAAFARYDAGLTDDWAISPELSGEAQTISFWAQSYDATNTWMEAIEVFYSTGSIYTEDFVTTGFTKNPLPNGWAKYEVELPAGARRFAIRSSSYDSFMLMIDDVTYLPASSHNVTPLGFNVYRDQVKLNDAPLAAPSFTDNVDDPMAHTWVVTAQYEEGESRGSNEATAGSGSIDSVGAMTGVNVRALPGRIVITGAEGLRIMVSAADGKLLFNADGDELTEVSVLPGVYVVKAGTYACKLVVNN